MSNGPKKPQHRVMTTTPVAADLDHGEIVINETDGKLYSKNKAGAVIEVSPGAAGGAAWGGITGTLSDQTDLQTELDGKSATGHNHDGVYDPDGSAATVQANLSTHEGDGDNPHGVTLADVGGAPASHTHPLAEVTDSGEMAAVDDAASDGETYGRKDGAWEAIVSDSVQSAVESRSPSEPLHVLGERHIVLPSTAQDNVQLYAPLKTSLFAQPNNVTLVRNDGADFVLTVTDYEGTVIPVKNGEARFTGARRIDHADGMDYGANALGIEYVDTDANGDPIPEATLKGLMIEADDVVTVPWISGLVNDYVVDVEIRRLTAPIVQYQNLLQEAVSGAPHWYWRYNGIALLAVAVGGAEVSGTPNQDLDNPLHYAFRKSATQGLEFWEDDVSINSSAGETADATEPVSGLRIGSDPATADRHLNGNLKNLKVRIGDLTDQQVADGGDGGYIGEWATHSQEIATSDGAAWSYETPAEGWQALVKEEGIDYTYNATGDVWEAASHNHDALYAPLPTVVLVTAATHTIANTSNMHSVSVDTAGVCTVTLAEGPPIGTQHVIKNYTSPESVVTIVPAGADVMDSLDGLGQTSATLDTIGKAAHVEYVASGRWVMIK